MPKLISSFTALNITQFLVALNDNFYKLLLVFFLINLQGEAHSNTILALAGTVYVIPFIIFASFAGTLADRLSKRSIIYFTRITEILTTSLGVVAFIFKSITGGYTVLFLMALHSALFSPCKYGIIPEIVPHHKISHYNGVITATTYLAIIFGTFLASFLTQITHADFILVAFFCVLIAIFEFIACLGIEKTKPQAARKKVSTHFIRDIIRGIVAAKKHRYLATSLIFGAYFFFLGAYTQLNIIPFTLQSLHLSEIQGGYLFLMIAIGIGIGSYLAGQASGKEPELGFVPLAVFGMALCFLCIYIFDAYFFIVVPMLILLGLFGGFFIVPIDAFIQVASPNKNRGQNVAIANFFSFIGVIVASGLLALLGNALKLSAAEGFFIVGWVTVFTGITLLLLYADQVLRLIVGFWARMFLHIRVWGKNRISRNKAALLIAPRCTWLDTIIVMATLPRLIRYIVPIKHDKRKYKRLYRLLWLIPIDIEHFSPLGQESLEIVKQELAAGHSVCLMHPVDIPSKTLQEWEAKLDSLLTDLSVPIIPIHIDKEIAPTQKGCFAQLMSLKSGPIKVSYGNAIPKQSEGLDLS